MITDPFWQPEKDRVTLLVKNPHTLFVFWDLERRSMKEGDLRIGLRLFAGRKGKGRVLVEEREVEVFSGSHWWNGVEPGIFYQVQLGVYGPAGVFAVMAVSEEVRTPLLGAVRPEIPKDGYLAMVNANCK